MDVSPLNTYLVTHFGLEAISIVYGECEGYRACAWATGGEWVCDFTAGRRWQGIVMEYYNLWSQRIDMKHTRSPDFLIAQEENGNKAITVLTDRWYSWIIVSFAYISKSLSVCKCFWVKLHEVAVWTFFIRIS